jgi:hypothetical protein
MSWAKFPKALFNKNFHEYYKDEFATELMENIAPLICWKHRGVNKRPSTRLKVRMTFSKALICTLAISTSGQPLEELINGSPESRPLDHSQSSEKRVVVQIRHPDPT